MTVVHATAGRDLGTRPSRRLRVEGQLPAVVYGRGKDPVTVQVTYTELREALKGPAGLNTVLTLDIDGQEDMVIVRDIQRDPIRRTVRHADFLRVSEDSKIKVTVPVVLTGRPAKVLDNGGMLEQKRHELMVLVSPANIPHQIEADISDMDMDDRLAVGELVLPSGVEPLVDPNLTIAATVVPRGLKSMAEEEEEALLGEEGAEADAEGDAEGGDASGDDE